MGVASDLAYELGHQNLIRKGAGAVAATRLMSALNRRFLRPTDRLVLRLTGGNSTLTTWVSGIPTLWLTTTGARTGGSRIVPLLGIPVNDDLALIGSSFGQKAAPGWVHNLEAHPEALVSYRGSVIEVTARRAEPAEESAIWEKATSLYPGYANYVDWTPDREIRVFVLESRRGRPVPERD